MGRYLLVVAIAEGEEVFIVTARDMTETEKSLGAELQAMLDEMMWQGIEAGYRRLATNSEEMTAYQSEVTEWTSADLSDLAATAAEEYPEYNA